MTFSKQTSDHVTPYSELKAISLKSHSSSGLEALHDLVPDNVSRYTCLWSLLFSAPDYLPVPLLLFKLVEHALWLRIVCLLVLLSGISPPPTPDIHRVSLPLHCKAQIKCPLFREASAKGPSEKQHLSSITSSPSTLLSLWDLSTPETLSFFLCFNMKKILSFHCYWLVAREVAALSRCLQWIVVV